MGNCLQMYVLELHFTCSGGCVALQGKRYRSNSKAAVGSRLQRAGGRAGSWLGLVWFVSASLGPSEPAGGAAGGRLGCGAEMGEEIGACGAGARRRPWDVEQGFEGASAFCSACRCCSSSPSPVSLPASASPGWSRAVWGVRSSPAAGRGEGTVPGGWGAQQGTAEHWAASDWAWARER